MSKFEDVISVLSGLVLAVSTVSTWLFDKLPPLAALATILWVGWQWYHSAPMVARRRRRRAIKNGLPPPEDEYELE